MTQPPQNPDNICLIFEEKKSWYKAAMKAEKSGKFLLMFLCHLFIKNLVLKQMQSLKEKALWVIPWKEKIYSCRLFSSTQYDLGRLQR